MHAACTNVQSPPPPSFVAAWLEKYPIFVWWEKAFRKIFAQQWGDSYGRHQWTFILSLLHTRQQLLFSVHNHVLSLPLAHFFHSFSIHTHAHTFWLKKWMGCCDCCFECCYKRWMQYTTEIHRQLYEQQLSTLRVRVFVLWAHFFVDVWCGIYGKESDEGDGVSAS
jgi:hypothetical protein